MKTNFLITIITVLSVSSAFAEREMSKLQYVETTSCSTQELEKTIRETANRVMYEDTNLTTLEDALSLTQEQKKSGMHADVYKVAPRSSLSAHTKSVAKAEATAVSGQVGVTKPATFDVVFEIKNSNNELVGKRGRITLDVTCRVEQQTINGVQSIRHSGQLVSFEVKTKK